MCNSFLIQFLPFENSQKQPQPITYFNHFLNPLLLCIITTSGYGWQRHSPRPNFLGPSEFLSQLCPDFSASMFVSALSDFTKNPAKCFSQRPPSLISDHPWCLIRFFILHSPPQVQCNHPPWPAASDTPVSQNPPLPPLMLPLAQSLLSQEFVSLLRLVLLWMLPWCNLTFQES